MAERLPTYCDPPGEPAPVPAYIRINAIQTSVDYGDFLAWTLPENKHHFDNTLIITAPHDKLTQSICAHYHVRCIPTDVWWNNGDLFNKARGINLGLSQLALTERDWVLHLDADLWLPPRTGEILHSLKLDPTCIYGIDRMECQSFPDWIGFKCNPSIQHEFNVFVKPRAFPLGARLVLLNADGYVPLGCFQLWNPAVSRIIHYAESQNNAARSDMLFAMQWPRIKRQHLPEIVGIHLESEKPETMGRNWNGRVSKPFRF